jgi:NAD(P)-dependent dehydrogenase (short-subunit alcohol dehydrogenase family)
MRALTFPTQGAVAVFGGSGGAGSGICQAFASAGCDVAFTYHSNATRADELETELSEAGCRTRAYRLDLAAADAVHETVANMRADFGDIHTVVYAAGPKFEVVNVCDVPPAAFQSVANVELLGFFHILHATMPLLRRNSGSVVACVTFANRRVLPFDGQSAAPKAGIESLVRQIAWEEAPHEVRANAVGLGWMDFGLGAVGGGERSMLQGEMGEQLAAEFASKVPLGHRPGRAQELADAVLFMASEQAAYITGQCLLVDGGMSL